MHDVFKKFLTILAGIGSFSLLIGVVWRLFMSGESVEESTYSIMRYMVIGGAALTALSGILIINFFK
jgi:hypothetical protein